MATYHKRPTEYKEAELAPDVDLEALVAGTPLTVVAVYIPEDGTGLVEVGSSAVAVAGISVTWRAGQFLRVAAAPGAPLVLALTDRSVCKIPDCVEGSKHSPLELNVLHP